MVFAKSERSETPSRFHLLGVSLLSGVTWATTRFGSSRVGGGFNGGWEWMYVELVNTGSLPSRPMRNAEVCIHLMGLARCFTVVYTHIYSDMYVNQSSV